jgi:hypothetical protein
MFTEVDLHFAPHVQTNLEALEQELGRPIRLLNAGGRTYANKAWSTAMIRGCTGFTAEQCREEGLTVWSYGSLHQIRYRDDRQTYDGGGGLFTAGIEESGYTFYDMLTMPDSPADWVADPLTTDNGFLFGEVGERVVVWHLPFMSYRDTSFDMLLKGPLLKSIDTEFLAGLVERRASHTRDAFVRFAMRVSNEGLEALRREVGSLMTKNSRAIAEAARTKVELRSKQRMLDTLMADEDEVSEPQMLETWGKLLDDPRIENVHFDSANRVVLDTIGLDLTHPTTGQTVYLGKMRWIIAADGSDMCEVHNLDNARGGFDHPHVNMNLPCFGELGSTIFTLIKQGKLYPAVELIFAFLGSINLQDDWARRAAFWFEDPMDSPRREPVLTDTEDAVIDEILDELVIA